MRSFVSAMVLAASFALLVPDNQTLRAAESYRALPVAVPSVFADPVASSNNDAPGASTSNMTWLLAAGFLAAVISRRLGSE
jgi:hypothetical protein